MNDLTAVKKHHPIILLLRNLPKGTTEEHVSAFLWQRLGWSIGPEQLSVKNLEPPFESANCLVVIGRRSLADFFSRALENLAFDGRMLQVHQPVASRSLTTSTEEREDE